MGAADLATDALMHESVPASQRKSMKAKLVFSSLVLALGATGVAAQGDHHLTAAHDYSFGRLGGPANAATTVEIDVTDAMRFNPPSITVKKGETVRFALKNSGQIRHVIVLDTIKELREHAELMAKCPRMEQGNPNQVSLEPGKTGELIWQFTKGGTFDVACPQLGHFAAGMRGRIVVN